MLVTGDDIIDSAFLDKPKPFANGLHPVETDAKSTSTEHLDLSLDDFDKLYGERDFGYRNDQFMVFPETSLDHSEKIGDVAAVSVPTLTNLPVTADETRKVTLPCLFSSDITDIGTVPGVVHNIPIGDAAPTVTHQWRLPHTARQIIREQCDMMEKAGVIEPSTNP